MSKIHLVDQGSAEWYAVRLGIPTASNFHKIVTPAKGELSTAKTMWDYMHRLIAERLLKDSMDSQLKVEWIEHGKAEEPHAAQHFEFTNSVHLEPVGFVTNDEGRLGCSPDALIRGSREAVEIKCPAPWTQIGYLLDGPGADYQPQVQGQIWVGQFECVHFYSYHPRMPAQHIPTLPNPNYLPKLSSALSYFVDELDRRTERARALGAYVVTERVTRPLDQAYGDQAAQEAEPPIQVVVPDGGSILDAG